ncbi:MAG: DUF362 domain-containing protein [Deltaproteobacteria bacterium]
MPAIPVALLPCSVYDRRQLKKGINALLESLHFSVGQGCTVLLKPNLVSGRGHDGLACTNPEFVAATAELFLDYGARVRIGDSPAFGTALDAMFRCGYNEALSSLPVEQINFSKGPLIPLPGGVSVRIAREALDCDLLVNLPRVKAHAQLRITLAVKNLFGTVLGWQKPVLHMRLGNKDNAFARMVVEIAALYPSAFHLADGVIAMHRNGPITGTPLSLGLIGAAANPVALDTALLAVIGARPDASPIWQECNQRHLPGSALQDLSFPLFFPEQLKVQNFILPASLHPVRFHPLNMGAITIEGHHCDAM